jgi:SAM-dependent methyltransferase
MNCPLCGEGECACIAENRRRKFLMCKNCTLVFVPENYYLPIDLERQRYDLHDNSASNDGYVRFLGQVADIVCAFTAPASRVLDYGCGKNAVLTGLLTGRGRLCDPFDPLYDYPLKTGGGGTYDAIVMCEVIEHCRNIAATLADVRTLLTPGGLLLLRTQLYPPSGDIARWWYAQDPTHINFFSWKAIEAVAATVERPAMTTDSPDIFILQASKDACSTLPQVPHG